MSWYRTGRVVVTNGSKTVTGVGTLFTTAVNVGDAFALVDANLNPTGAWYEVEAVVSNAEITLKQSYAGTTGSNNQFCIFNMVGNMTTPSFAQRLATFFASFQSLIDKTTATPTALGIPIADENGNIADGWISTAKADITYVDAGLALKANTTDVDDALALKADVTDVADALALKAPLASPTFTGDVVVPDQIAGNNSTKAANTKYVDAKVAESITNGVTGIAPSQDVVFDALALKTDLTYAEYLMMEGDPA